MIAPAPPKPVSLKEPSLGLPLESKRHDGPYYPKAPNSFKEAGLDTGIVEALILKFLQAIGSASGAAIARELCLPPKAVIEYLAGLKHYQIVVHVGSATMGDFTYALTEQGRERAARFLVESLYVGPAPVPIDAYIQSVHAQTIANLHPQEKNLRDAFSDLLISREMFLTLGPAINSGRGLFLYGYPGNGKSSIAERITKCFGDEVYIPRAVIVDGMVIKLFDPQSHEEVPFHKDSIVRGDLVDPRWVKVKRPTIVVGGELTMEALEVQYNTTSKICEAPTQMKSNLGTLVIDDFGRQRMKPIELLNRWIIPLEKRFDYLALPNGKKVRIPFDQLIIFSTNLEPKELCDDAFLRRIPYKINVANPTEAEFRELFNLVAPQLGFKLDTEALEAIDYLIETHYHKTGRPFRCCQPRDLLMQVRNHCLYRSEEEKMSKELFDYAVSVYFTVM